MSVNIEQIDQLADQAVRLAAMRNPLEEVNDSIIYEVRDKSILQALKEDSLVTSIDSFGELEEFVKSSELGLFLVTQDIKCSLSEIRGLLKGATRNITILLEVRDG